MFQLSSEPERVSRSDRAVWFSTTQSALHHLTARILLGENSRPLYGTGVYSSLLSHSASYTLCRQPHSTVNLPSAELSVTALSMFPTYTQWLAAARASTTKQSTTSSTSRVQDVNTTSDPLPVLVIGAGPAGLAIMAELSTRAVPFVCMEQSVDVGGMWDRHNNTTSPVYPSLNTNVSKFSMTLSKPFDMPDHWPSYVPHQLAHSYLQSFADRHSLKPNIRFSHRVQQCEFDSAAQRWHVRFTHGTDGVEGSGYSQ